MHRTKTLSSPPILLITIASLVWSIGCRSAAQVVSGSPPAPPVLVTEVQPTDVPIYSEYSAQTYARDTVEVRGRVDGYIDKWLFHPGQEVHAGDALYVLDLRPYQAALELAKGNVAQSEADLEFARNHRLAAHVIAREAPDAALKRIENVRAE